MMIDDNTFPSPVLWHGGPGLFTDFHDPDPLARLYANWLAADPLVAAIYAGEGGWVMPFRLAPGTRLLDASGGVAGRPVHHLDRACMAALDAAAEAARVTALWDPDSDEPRHPLGPNGELAWEDLLDVSDMDCEDLRRGLLFYGVDAVLCTEALGAVKGDRQTLFDAAPPGGTLVTAWRRLVADHRPLEGCADVVAVLHPHLAIAAGTPVAARDVLRDAAQGRPRPVTDIQDIVGAWTCQPGPARPVAEAPSRRPF